MIFRQELARPRTEVEQQRLAEEMGPWARKINAAGHKLDPRILAAQVASFGADGSPVRSTDAWPVTALLFVEASDLNEAAQIAASHPGLQYGAQVEVRPWALPAALALAAENTPK